MDLLSSQILEEHGIIYFNGDHWCITIRTEGQFLLLPEPASLYTKTATFTGRVLSITVVITVMLKTLPEMLQFLYKMIFCSSSGDGLIS